MSVIRDPVIDAPALGLKEGDDLGFGALEELNETGWWILPPTRLLNPSPADLAPPQRRAPVLWRGFPGVICRNSCVCYAS